MRDTSRRRLSEKFVECSRVPDERPELGDLAARESEELDSILIEDLIAPHMVIVDKHRYEVIAGHDVAGVDREVGRATDSSLAEERNNLVQALLVACEPASARDMPEDVLS